ncbi:MAG: hypothetical protein ABEJ23_08005 [Haloarculaceae archaeon]
MAPSTGTLLRESAPVAVVVGFWLVLSWFGREPAIATGVRYAGVLMGLLYAVVRGVRLADASAAHPAPSDAGELLAENVRVAVPAGAWFLAAVLVDFAAELWRPLVGVGLFTSPAAGLSFVFTATGVLTVVLYAVAVGLPRVRDEPSARPDAAGDAATAD